MSLAHTAYTLASSVRRVTLSTLTVTLQLLCTNYRLLRFLVVGTISCSPAFQAAPLPWERLCSLTLTFSTGGTISLLSTTRTDFIYGGRFENGMHARARAGGFLSRTGNVSRDRLAGARPLVFRSAAFFRERQGREGCQRFRVDRGAGSAVT